MSWRATTSSFPITCIPIAFTVWGSARAASGQKCRSAPIRGRKIEPAENLAKICERYGGGGHARVGAISFPPGKLEEARHAAKEIVAELRASYRRHMLDRDAELQGLAAGVAAPRARGCSSTKKLQNFYILLTNHENRLRRSLCVRATKGGWYSADTFVGAIQTCLLSVRPRYEVGGDGPRRVPTSWGFSLALNIPIDDLHVSSSSPLRVSTSRYRQLEITAAFWLFSRTSH